MIQKERKKKDCQYIQKTAPFIKGGGEDKGIVSVAKWNLLIN